MRKIDLIVKDNALIDASYSLDVTEQRLILLSIIEAREAGKGITADGFLEIHASSYMNQFKVEKHAAYEALSNACKSLFRRYFTYQDTDLKTGKSRLVESRWVSKVAYIKDAAMVQICFAPDVIPLITRLESNFTSYEIQQISSLSSAYAIRLYELLIKWRSLGQTPLINIDDFRKQLGVGIDEYQRMGAFKERVLNLAMQQINEHTDIIVNYEQHKTGRVITGFSFTFTQKKQPKDVTPDTKKAKPKPTEDLNTLLHDKKFLEKHARAGESWDDVRSRLKNEAETGKFSLAPTN
ncbi:MAG TPA: replication initiation protein RepM [Agitococcus sp.]|nr:replication initiation protein RepM [Pseudomonadales bacterium]HQV22179.1 replication initiation protein RepM [Agitococcus sp.]